MELRLQQRQISFTVLLIGIMLILSTVGKTQNSPIKIACVGNSVTFGYGLKDPATQSYPALLQEKLGPNYKVENFGHSGATLLRKGHRPYFKTPEFHKAIALKADIVIIHLGLNDTDPRDFPNFRDDFIPDYNWLIDTFRRSNPSAKIYICKMTPIFTGHPRFLSSTYSWYKDLQKRIEQVAQINNVPLIDLFDAFHDRPDLITDAPTLHPNRAGTKKLAGVIYQSITGKYGGLQLADIFTDGMVLQREKPIQIWGLADAGTVVDIRFNELEKKVTVPTDGKWTIVFPPMPASGKPANMQILNAGKKTNLHNILIGDVWLCSGQSNMAFTVSQSMGADSILKAIPAKTNLRLFHYKPLAETDNAAWDSSILQKTNQLDFFSGHWQIPDGASVAPFSAIGYIFGKQIEQQEQIPIGLIELAVGGSPLISWLDRATLESHPAFEPALNNWRNSDYLMEWCRERAAKNLEAATGPYQRHPYEPCYNFEAGVAKITKFPIKGVIWYQGESDAENAELYQKLFPLFVENWRQAWQQDFPFYYVQLSSISRPSWNYFRDMQRKLLSAVPGTAMVVTSDLGDSTNVHYLNKIPVGLRLANLALHDSYHRQNLVPSGPLFKSVQNKQRQLRISFLYSKGLRSSDGQPLRGFEVMDKRGNLIAVEASVEGDQVKIEVPNAISIDKIVYGWKPFNHANLINGAGLPASTFMASVKTTNENN